jgi:hypothetical protein
MTAAAQPNFGPSELAVEALRTQALILSLIKDIRTAIPVKVVAVHPGVGAPPAIGTVDVQPLVQTVDGAGKLWSLGVTYGAQFCRIQAGATAIVVDPSVNDIGLAIACDRDISSVIASAGLAAPGSARAHDISDLIYLYSVVSAAAITQYILANAEGITLLSPNTITIQGAQINMIGPINANGATISGAGEITDAASKVLGTHIHPDPQGGVTGPPV